MNRVKIAVRAVRIRMSRGETFEQAVGHYKNLTTEEITEIKESLDIKE